MADPIVSGTQVGASATSNTPQGGAPSNARALIDSVTDPRTGAVDTRHLAQLAADSTRQDPARGREAYAAIEAELLAQNAGDASRFHRDYADAASHWVPGPDGRGGVAQGWADAGRRTLVNNPILSVQWESTRSAWTLRGGFTYGARKALEDHGLEVNPNVNPTPSAALGRKSGVPHSVANNTNGALARDAIAQRLEAQGRHSD